MAALSDITVKKELRLCKANKELGYFHCWEQHANKENICKNCLPKFVIGVDLSNGSDFTGGIKNEHV